MATNYYLKRPTSSWVLVYIGGKFKRDETIFKRLEKEGYVTNDVDSYYPFISVIDYEALQVSHDETIRGRDICYQHIPATFSVCSNIPDHSKPVHVTPTTACRWNGKYSAKTSTKSEANSSPNYSHVVESLKNRLNEINDSTSKEYRKIVFRADEILWSTRNIRI